MLAKILPKDFGQQPPSSAAAAQILRAEDINPRIDVHYGIPATASIMAFDPIQSLLAVGTLDGRIKVIGGDNIEGLFVYPKQIPFKNLEFLLNQGFLAAITAENEILVWDLEQRLLVSTLQWESNITAFSVICGLSYMYVGDEYGMVSVLKYDAVEGKLVLLPYCIPTDSIAEASGMSYPDYHPVVGLLPQPASQGNRLLIAYDDGLIVLWDVSEDKVILAKGNKDLQLKSKTLTDFHKGMGHELSDDISEYEHVEKEISSLCWASTDGSVLAVGYVDGDIMFWNLSNTTSADEKAGKLSNDVKLQLSTAERRLPVIVLHWSENCLSDDSRGQLFIYGGDAIGAEEALTILSVNWSSGIESIECIGRIDLTLNGSYADMVLLPSDCVSKAKGTLVLTSPGQLHFYDDACIASLLSRKQKQNSISSLQYPMIIPIAEPYITVAKLGVVNRDVEFSKAVYKVTHTSRSVDWPLTGGVHSQPLDAGNYQVERLYVAGYQDGSVRIWDATNPTFFLVYDLGPEVKGSNIDGANAPVTTLELCSFTLTLAIGNELGMIRLYKLMGNTNERSLHIVKETTKEVHTLPQGNEPQCTAAFSIVSSPICSLLFTSCGTRLTAGFHCGKVAMLDLSTLSVLFLIDSVSNSESPVRCLALRSFVDTISAMSNLEDAEPKSNKDCEKSEVFVMTENAHIVVIDDMTGNIVCSHSLQSEKELHVISLHIIEIGSGSEKYSNNLTHKNGTESEPDESTAHSGSTPLELDSETSAKTAYSGQSMENVFLMVCCEDALYLYSMKSLNEGDRNSIQTVNLLKRCCWTATLKKDENKCGLIVLYQNGVIEIRSLSDLEVVGQSSLMSIMRWNFKTNMERTICSSDAAEIMLVNASEFASISLLVNENNFRIPESLPCLHDKVLAAAIDATASLCPTQKKTKGASSGILGGFIKGLQASREEHIIDPSEGCNKNNFAHLGSIFSCPPFLKPSMGISNDKKVLDLNIDDIHINEPIVISPSPKTTKKPTKDKGTEKDRLFEGASSDPTPRLRTAEEIKAKYRKGDAAAAASQAKDKLAERGEKLERLSLRTEELQSGAQNFASMAEELAKQMEKRKWWNI